MSVYVCVWIDLVVRDVVKVASDLRARETTHTNGRPDGRTQMKAGVAYASSIYLFHMRRASILTIVCTLNPRQAFALGLVSKFALAWITLTLKPKNTHNITDSLALSP